MPDDAPSDSDELAEIYQGEIQPALESQARTTFKPWHKPRKHFLRLNQWCHETRQLLKRLKSAEGGELRYLGLPGEDLLDIRVLKGVCERAKLTLRYLGFDSSLTSAELNLSRHEVNSGQFIHASSVVIKDRLEQLAIRDTVACQYVERHAPFDAINLDLCDSVTDLAEKGTIPNLEAIRTLCDVQIRLRGRPWLLFLTTRAIRDNLDTETRKKLFERLLSNVAGSRDFATSLSEKLSLNEVAIREELKAGAALDGHGWIRAYVLAVAKWLLHYMVANDYVVAVHMLPSYTYSVKHGCQDMVSLAFFFEPAPILRQDDSNLTQPRRQQEMTVNELELAKELIDQIAAMEDLDEKLKSDGKLNKKMFQKSSALLSTLRYDLRAYQKFAFAD